MTLTPTGGGTGDAEAELSLVVVKACIFMQFLRFCIALFLTLMCVPRGLQTHSDAPSLTLFDAPNLTLDMARFMDNAPNLYCAESNYALYEW